MLKETWKAILRLLLKDGSIEDLFIRVYISNNKSNKSMEFFKKKVAFVYGFENESEIPNTWVLKI